MSSLNVATTISGRTPSLSQQPEIDVTLKSVVVEKMKASRSTLKLAKLIVPKKFLLLKLKLASRTETWEISKTFAEVARLQKALRKECTDVEVPALPRIPTKRKYFDEKEWFNFLTIILDDPAFLECGALRTFISTQNQSDDVLHAQFGEVIKEGPLVYQKKSSKLHKKTRDIECWCQIRLRAFFIYRTKYDISPLGMLMLDESTVDLSLNLKSLPSASAGASNTQLSPRSPYRKLRNAMLNTSNSNNTIANNNSNPELKYTPSAGLSAPVPAAALSPPPSPSGATPVGMPMEQSYEKLEPPPDLNRLHAFVVTPKGSNPYTFVPASADEKDSWLAAIEAVAKSRATTHFRVVSTLIVQVEKASHIDTSGARDPFALLHIDHQQLRTATIKRTLDPVWHETFQFNVAWYSAVLYLSVWDEDNVKGDFLGKLAIPVAALPVDEEVEVWLSLAPKAPKHPVTGVVHLRMKYSFTLEEEDKEKEKETKKIFGVMVTEEEPLPPPIRAVMAYVEERGLQVEGLFRISANAIEMSELRKFLDQGNDVDFTRNSNIHDWGGLLKLWLRELPEPVLTYDAYPSFLSTIREKPPDEVVPALRALIHALPPPNKALLKELLPFLHRVAAAHETTRMNISNLAVVFSPSLLRSRVETLDSLMADSSAVAKTAAVLIANQDVLLAP